MLIGIGVIALGFIVMAMDTTEFGFGILGLTVGPVIVVGGFAFQFFAILHEGKRPEPKQSPAVAQRQSEPVVAVAEKETVQKNKGKKGAKRMK